MILVVVDAEIVKFLGMQENEQAIQYIPEQRTIHNGLYDIFGVVCAYCFNVRRIKNALVRNCNDSSVLGLDIETKGLK